MSSRCLILGLAAGYHYGDVRPFAASLQQSGFAGTCVLFASETTRHIPEICSHDIHVVPYKRPESFEHIPYNAFRYLLYRQYLIQHWDEFDRVLFTDVRDVIFQSDPFDYPWKNGINATLEDQCMTIGECPYTGGWVEHHLGAAAKSRIAEKHISCSGTTLGDKDSMLAYLAMMIDIMLPYKPEKGMAGYDQGIHNYMLHTQMLPNIQWWDNSGPILTLAYKNGEPAVDEYGKILSDSGKPAVIVHQYDRKPTLFKRIREQYS